MGISRHLLLALTAFISGASIMVIELTGNRILAPAFGNSLYTWTGLIGVILVAMSGGYYFGGWLADRRPSYIILAHLILGAAIFTLIIPLLRFSLEGEGYFAGIDPVRGPLAASLIFFAIPGFLLGSVSPFAIRLRSSLSSDKQVGVSAGYIGMFSVLGSVGGTFGAGFVLIPKMGAVTIFLVTGIILVLLAFSCYFIFLPARKERIKYTALSIFIPLCVASVIFKFSPTRPENVIFDKTTFYHRILILRENLPDGDYLKTLRLDTTVEGAQYEKSREIAIPYQRYWRLAQAYCPKIEKAVFLGGGSFTMPEALMEAYPEAEVEVVEIDPEVVEAGKRFFRVNEYGKMKVITDDCRRYLHSNRQHYQLIFGDAYNGIHNIPAHLVTLEFFSLVKERLSEQGVYMMNIVSAVKGKDSGLFLSIVKTLSEVFGHLDVYALDPGCLERVQNIILAASDNKEGPSPGDKERKPYRPELEKLLDTYLSPDNYHPADHPIFTDDYNPVEYIVAKTIRP